MSVSTDFTISFEERRLETTMINAAIFKNVFHWTAFSMLLLLQREKAFVIVMVVIAGVANCTKERNDTKRREE